MHALSFMQKRLHLAATARGREMFAHIEDMTPARFDILYAMHQNMAGADEVEANGTGSRIGCCVSGSGSRGRRSGRP